MFDEIGLGGWNINKGYIDVDDDDCDDYIDSDEYGEGDDDKDDDDDADDDDNDDDDGGGAFERVSWEGSATSCGKLRPTPLSPTAFTLILLANILRRRRMKMMMNILIANLMMMMNMLTYWGAGVHFSFDVLPFWADQGSCAHKCVC